MRRLAAFSVRTLLLLYARRFRNVFAAEMLDVFEDRYADISGRHHGRMRRTTSIARLLLSTWVNIVTSAVSERIKNSQAHEISLKTRTSCSPGARSATRSSRFGASWVEVEGDSCDNLAGSSPGRWRWQR